jgi:hypothetical protein
VTCWFYPERTRCLGCRRYFGFIVIKRLYCSYKCAGMEPPAFDPAQRPRCCRTRVGEAKRAYFYPEEVVTPELDVESDLHVYPCDCCGMYHIGHTTRSRV